MRSAYKILGGLIALLVFVQAGSIAFAYSGMGIWIQDGGTLDAAAMESRDTTFTGVAGFIVHGMTGMMLIPLLAFGPSDRFLLRQASQGRPDRRSIAGSRHRAGVARHLRKLDGLRRSAARDQRPAGVRCRGQCRPSRHGG